MDKENEHEELLKKYIVLNTRSREQQEWNKSKKLRKKGSNGKKTWKIKLARNKTVNSVYPQLGPIYH